MVMNERHPARRMRPEENGSLTSNVVEFQPVVVPFFPERQGDAVLLRHKKGGRSVDWPQTGPISCTRPVISFKRTHHFIVADGRDAAEHEVDLHDGRSI